MPWLWIYDIRVAAPVSDSALLPMALCGLLLLAGAVYTAWQPGKRGDRFARASVLCGGALMFAAVCWSMLHSIPITKSLVDDLNMGHFSTASGTISDAQIINRRSGSTLVFSVGAQRFVFPYQRPWTCMPQNGEASKIQFVPYATPGFYRTTGTIVRMAMTRHCPSGEW